MICGDIYVGDQCVVSVASKLEPSTALEICNAIISIQERVLQLFYEIMALYEWVIGLPDGPYARRWGSWWSTTPSLSGTAETAKAGIQPNDVHNRYVMARTSSRAPKEAGLSRALQQLSESLPLTP